MAKKRKKRTAQEAGNEFHDWVKELFEKCGFRKIKSNYNAPGPDLIVEAEKIKIIIQCKSTEREDATFPSIEKVIHEYATKVKKFKAKVAIIALKNYNLTSEIKKKRKKILEMYKVAIWDNSILEYYWKLSSMLSDYTKYQMFGDLSLREDFNKPLEVKYVKLKQGPYSFYAIDLCPEYLLKNGYVLRRVYDEEAYQRLLDKKRITIELPGFLDSDSAVLPNAIICSSDYPIEIKKNKILLKNRYASLWIIDGQHRVYGFTNIKNKKKLKEFNVLCAIFDGTKITKSEQGQIFVDINKHAKRVHPALILELYPKLNMKERAVDTVYRLRETPLFKNNVSTYSYKKGHINITTFVYCQAMTRLCEETGPILRNIKQLQDKQERDKKNEEICFKVLKNYFQAIKDNFKKEWNRPNFYILATDKGLRPLLHFLIKILKYRNYKYNDKKTREIIHLLKKEIEEKKINLSKNYLIGQYAGEAGAKKLADDWAMLVNHRLPDFDLEVVGENEQTLESKRFSRGDKKNAETFILHHLKHLKGDIRGILAHIDKTTFGYLRHIDKKSSIRLIVGVIGDGDKCKKLLKEMKEQGWNIIITQSEKITDLAKTNSLYHERWIGTDEFRIRLNTDLKKDAIANSTNIKQFIQTSKNSEHNTTFEHDWGVYKELEGTKHKYDWPGSEEN